MFQSILERIVLKYFGEYLLDFDKKNISLAVWSGKLKIEGLKFKPTIFDHLDLPIELRYSWIGNLEIFIPWSKLSILPVEIKIYNIFLIMGPLESHKWKLKLETFNEKIEIIETYLRALLSNKTANDKPMNPKKANFIDIMITNIIDNIQLNIENIHIRFENNLNECPYSLGITLKQLKVETKDTNWSENIFYDRTNIKNKYKPINKNLIINNFGIYLNSNNKNFFSIIKDFVNINDKMAVSYLHDNSSFNIINDYLLDISIDLKLTMNFDNNYFMIPEYKGDMAVENISLNIKNTQIQNVIRLLEFFNEFEFFLNDFKTRTYYFPTEKPILLNIKVLTKEQKEKLVSNLWKYAFFQIRKTNYVHYLTYFLTTNKSLSQLKQIKIQDFRYKALKKIMRRTSVESLKLWTQIAVERFISLNPSIFSKIPFFSFFSNFSTFFATNDLITFDEKAELVSFFEKQNLYGSYEKQQKSSGKPPSYFHSVFSFKLHKGKIKIEHIVKDNEEGLILKWHDLSLELKVSESLYRLEGKIHQFSVEHYNKLSRTTNNFVQLLVSDSKKQKPFLHMLFETNPEVNKKIGLSFRLFLDISTVEFTVFPLIIRRIASYFKFNSMNENLKEKAYKKVKHLQNLTKKSLEDLAKNPQKIEIYLLISSPVIIIPFKQSNDIKSPCLIIHLGNFKLISDENIPISTSNDFTTITDNQYYDSFTLIITAFKISYYYTLEDYRSKFSEEFIQPGSAKLKLGEIKTPSKFAADRKYHKSSRPFKIIKKLQITLNIQILKEELQAYTEKPRISLKIQMGALILGLHPIVITKVKNLQKLFDEDIEDLQDILQFERINLLENAEKLGILNRFDVEKHITERRYVALYGMYLYFFESPEKTIYESYYHLRECQLQYDNSSITLINKLKEKLVLLCENEEILKEWIIVLSPVIKKSQLNTEKRSQESISEQKNVIEVKLVVEVNETRINFYDIENMLWLNLIISEFNAILYKKQIDFELSAEVSLLYMTSMEIDNRLHPDLRYFLSNCPFYMLRSNKKNDVKKNVSSSYVISIHAQKLQKSSNIMINLKLPNLNINWKPKLIAKLLEFLLKTLSDQKQNNNLCMFPLETPLSDRDPIDYDEKPMKNKKMANAFKSSPSIELRGIDPMKQDLIDLIKTDINFDFPLITIILVTDNNISIGKIIGEQFKLDMILKKSIIEVCGQLANIRLMDVTGYPNSVHGYLKSQTENDFELISGILSLNFKFIDDDVFLEDKIYNYINLSFDGLKMNYLQQPILRFIDYLFDSIIGVLTDDYKTDEIIKNHPRRLKQIVKDPRFTDLKIKFKDFKINVLILPLLKEKLKISIREFSLENSASKDYERLGKTLQNNKNIQDFIFVDTISILLNTVVFYKEDEGFDEIKQMSNAFNMKINIQRIISSEEVMKFFRNVVEIDNSMKINMKTTIVKLHLQKQDYMHIMKIIFNNITFDDGIDQYVYAGSNGVEIPRPEKCREILLSLAFDKIMFSICESQTLWNLQYFDHFLPTIDIIFETISITYRRCCDYVKKIYIKSENFFGFSYDYVHKDQKDEAKIVMQGFANNLNKRKEKSIPLFLNKHHSLKIVRTSSSINPISDFEERESSNNSLNRSKSGIDGKPKFVLDVEISREGTKKIDITLQNFDFLLNLNLLFRLIGFTSTDNSIVLITPKEKSTPNPLHLSMNINGVNIFLQGVSQNRMAVCQGKINLYYQKNIQNQETYSPPPEKSLLKKDIDNEEPLKQSIHPVPKASRKGLEYSRFKVYIDDLNVLKWELTDWSMDDNILNNFPGKPKNFMINLNLDYDSINYQNQIKNDSYYNVSKILISNLQAHLSPDDVSLLYNTYNRQFEELWENNVILLETLDKILETLQYKRKISAFQPKEEQEEIAEYKQKITIQKADILLLNESKEGKGLSPFLKLILKLDPFLIKSIVKSKKLMSCYFEVFLVFYNPFSNKIEPMIEKTPFIFELIKTDKGITNLTLELAKNVKKPSDKSTRLNINISEEMLAVFFKFKDSWLEKLRLNNEILPKQTSFEIPHKKSYETPLKQSLTTMKEDISHRESFFLKVSPKDMLQSHHKTFISRKFANSYKIKNDSGYDLNIIKQHVMRKMSISKQMVKKMQNVEEDKKILFVIKAGETAEYQIESAEDDFEHDYCQPIKICLEFTAYSGHNYYIQNISINRLITQQTPWKSQNLTKDNLKNKFFICSVKLKETKTKLKIASSVTFFNRTAYNVEITIISEDFNQNLVFEVPHGKKKPVPIEYAENQTLFSVKFLHNINNIENFESKIFTFSSLTSPSGTRGFEGKQGDNFYYIIRSQNLFRKKLDIYIESLFSITNCLPMAVEVEFFTKTQKYEVERPNKKLSGQETFLYSMSSKESPAFISLLLPGFQKTDDILAFSENMTKTLEKVPIFSDLKAIQTDPINIFLIYQFNAIKENALFIYTKGCIINETKRNEGLLFHSVNIINQRKPLPGQNAEQLGYNIILFDETTQIAISHRENLEELSNTIDIRGDIKGGGGVKVAEIKKPIKENKGSFELYEYAVNISIKSSVDLTDETNQVVHKLTKIVEVSPKYIVINNTQKCLEISQLNVQIYDNTVIPKQNRRPFYWKDGQKPKLMVIRPKDTLKWNWSGGFEVSIPKTFTFLLRMKDFVDFVAGSEFIYNEKEYIEETSFFRVVIFKENEIHYISIYSLDEASFPYYIRNQTKSFSILFSQFTGKSTESFNIKNPTLKLIPNTSLPFAWIYPNHTNELEVSFLYQDRKDIIPFKKVFDLTRLTSQSRSLKIPVPGRSMVELDAKYIVNGPTIILEFSEIEDQLKEKQENNDEIAKVFFIFLKEFGISLIARNNKSKQNVELSYILFKDFELLLLEEIDYKTIQFRIKYLNIDNNSKYDAYHPVIFTPSLMHHYIDDDIDKKSNHCIDMIFKYNYKLNQLTWYDSIEIHIMPFTIRLEEDFIHFIYEWYWRVSTLPYNQSQEYENYKKKPLINLLFLKESRKHRKTSSLFEAQSHPTYDWEWLEIPDSNSIYINEIILPAIDCNFTFNKNLKRETDKRNKTNNQESHNMFVVEFSIISDIAEIFNTTFSNVNDAPIQLKGLRVRYIFDSKKGVLDRFLTHYKEGIISFILKIIGSINIIGNPVGLIRSIGSGVVDLIEKPIEGVARGPLGLGRGVWKGGTSFCKKTLSGTLNSISNLTETMGAGLSLLTFDEKYNEKRSRLMLNKPKHVLEGLYQGGYSLIKGIKSGVKSAFIFPKEGFEKEDTAEVFKGTIQGITSLIVKPIGGVFDATAKTTEGLKNMLTYYDDKPNFVRFRPPRVFYENERFIKRYDKRDAERLFALQKYQKGVFAKLIFLDSFENIGFMKKKFCLVLSLDYLVLMVLDKNGTATDVQYIETKNMVECNAREEKQNWLVMTITYLKNSKEKGEEKGGLEKWEIRTEIGSHETKKNRKIPDALLALRDYCKERENSDLTQIPSEKIGK